ncbi:sulfotransferase domain-containing protein [Dactylosporangium sp. NBC_01737]|uniref:sulfotransferase family protein n=1 Tax=Dactylosporangium sp. NBC_01737 TaxID=2975959 RepID=UPI002E144C3F|nr:sulfotransferase domain-containing protein [Dactylosporangium sp. NBC_01737]
MALPDFLVAGVPKAGTSALHAALVRHPQLFLPEVKEPKFFLSDGPPPDRGGPGDRQTYQEHVWRREEYEALFDPAPPGTLRGEATPFYLYDLESHKRIRRLVPAVRIVLLLRDPVDRAHSNWSHLWGAGLEPEADFEKAVALEPARTAAGWADFWHYTALGRYGSQLRHLLQYFPREQILLLRYRDLRDDPAGTVDRVCAFLGVATGHVAQIPPENVRHYVADTRVNAGLRFLLRNGGRIGHHFPVPVRHAFSGPLLALLHRQHGRRPKVTPEQRAALLPRFVEEIELLQEVSGESYADWLSLDHASNYH